jgi:hypothetical protein
MSATHFVFISRFRLHADAVAVWRLLADAERWPQWWPYVHNVQRGPLQHAVADPTHAAAMVPTVDIDWRGALGFDLRVRVSTTRTQCPQLLEGLVTGDLRGSALWLIEPAANGAAVDVSYRWQCDLHRPWMRLFAWLLRPAFTRIHFKVMRVGAQGMARRLGCRVSDLSEWSGGPH